MNKIRENPGLSNRSSSPKAYSPTEGITTSSSNESVPAQPAETKRPGFFSRTSGGNGGRNSPSKKPPIPTNLSTVQSQVTSPNEIDESPLDFSQEGREEEDLDAERMVPSGAGSGFVLVESPSSKARAMKALKKEQEHQNHHHHHHRSGSNSAGVSSVPANRTKYLPTPPVAPVMPDFNDFVAPPSRKNSPLEVPDEGGLKRKTSMVKKLKDRMAK